MTFIVNYSEYIDESARMEKREAKNLQCLIRQLFGTNSFQRAKEANGDGMPFISVFDLANNKQVFPWFQT